jgi:hypothetical protein
MTKRYACILVFGLPILWQGALGLLPGVISIILQLLNLGGGGLTFPLLLAIIVGMVGGIPVPITTGFTELISAPVFVLVL